MSKETTRKCINQPTVVPMYFVCKIYSIHIQKDFHMVQSDCYAKMRFAHVIPLIKYSNHADPGTEEVWHARACFCLGRRYLSGVGVNR